MAHGDYDCCAVCDKKLSYSRDAQTKDEICPSCIKVLVNLGVQVFFPDELIEWVQDTDPVRVKLVLSEVDFCFCHYPNSVDKVVGDRLNIRGELRYGSLRKILEKNSEGKT